MRQSVPATAATAMNIFRYFDSNEEVADSKSDEVSANKFLVLFFLLQTCLNLVK